MQPLSLINRRFCNTGAVFWPCRCLFLPQRHSICVYCLAVCAFLPIVNDINKIDVASDSLEMIRYKTRKWCRRGGCSQSSTDAAKLVTVWKQAVYRTTNKVVYDRITVLCRNCMNHSMQCLRWTSNKRSFVRTQPCWSEILVSSWYKIVAVFVRRIQWWGNIL